MGSAGFFLICILHSVLALTCGTFMMFYTERFQLFSHGIEVATFVKDREFQSFFAKGCVLLHVSVAVWRVYFGRALEDLAHDLPRQVVGILHYSFMDFLSCVFMERNCRVNLYCFGYLESKRKLDPGYGGALLCF
ncbi:uncharacterized protein LOC116107616 [Pistacia vera]|uniref:uncharacterized protein LOC116107616 n=1 Tax=Pistacia vera TaxID=55513 RepID=UPI001262FDBA|nr:uncharacterized protein LOC116107616 [Pistacia vera]